MSTKLRRYLPTLLKLVIILLVVAGFATFWYYRTLPDRADAQQTLVFGPTRLAPASAAALRVVVQEVGSGQPVAGAAVKIGLQAETGGPITSLFAGVTDDSGSLPVSFRVPAEAEAEQKLIVETESAAGSDRLERPVAIERDYRLLLTTDKPLYQPGQTIHLRALALSKLDLTPARGATVNFLVEDAKGNKVFRQSVATSDFGIAAVDFTLADLVNQGNYKLSVTLGNTTSEKTVEVKPYVLPKFGLSLTTDRPFYIPGQRVEGTLQADYFFGKPVAESEVRLTGLVYDVSRVELVNLTGQTDAAGAFEFSFDLPAYFAGSGLDSQQAQFALEATVIDQTDHAEQTSLIVPVAAQPIVIEAVAESGSLRPGVKNIIYILTAYPDGTPAPTRLDLTVNGRPGPNLATGEFGLAEFRFTPEPGQPQLDLIIQAETETGFSASRAFQIQSEAGADHVLLRADRAAYLVGETMQLTALTPVNAGSLYLDIVKEGQTLSTRAALVQAGRADFAIDLSPDLYGALELHAYKVLADSSLVRDSRVVVVDAPRDLNIAINADRASYLPGGTAAIAFQTTDRTTGEPVQSAMGVAVVDESVFALQRQDPGFAKLYFLLEAELMEPFYQIEGFQLPAAYTPDQAPQRAAQDTSARAVWADAPTSGLAMQVNTRPEKLAALQQAQADGLQRLSTITLIGLALIPALLWLVVGLALAGSGVVKRSLIGLAKVSGILLLILAAMYGIIAFATSVSYQVQEFFWRLDPENILLLLAFGFGLALLGLAGYAWFRQDEAAKFIFLLTAAWIGLLILLVNLVDEGPEPAEGWAVLALLAFVLVPGAYLLYGQKLWAEKRRGPAWLPTIMGGLVTAPALVAPLLGLSMSSGSFAGPDVMRGDGMMLAGEPVMVEMAMPAAMEMVEEKAAAEAPAPLADEITASAEAPRLRQFFPETLYWNPEVLTDPAGQARLEIPMADSITTWRLTALASSEDGRLGFATQGVRVFQDFFVDIDLPVALTQGDEISIPVGVFNYLPQGQEVRLVVEPASWFELLGQAEQTLTIAANDIDVVYFPIRVKEFGRQGFQVTAWGEQMSDAIRREVRVLPNGLEVRHSDSNWLRENKEIVLNIPAEIIPRTSHVEVKIYTGALAQVIEGLEKILRLPHG